MTPEGYVKQQVMRYLDSLGDDVFVDRRQAGGFSYKKGIPDLYVIYKGYHIEIETKCIGGEQSTMQEKFERKMKRCGAIYILADRVEKVKEVFEKL